MIDILQQKWPEILDFFKQEYDIQDISFKTFILPLKVKSFENNVVTLVFTGRSGSASLQYINKKYFDFLQISISVVLEEDIELQIVLPGDDEEKKVSSIPAVNDEDLVLEKRIHEAHLDSKYTFDSFVVGNNAAAQVTSLAVADSPGEVYNPLFIYGGVGLGKTHLLQSIGNYILKQDKKAKVLYTDTESFTNEVIDLLRAKQTSQEEIIEFRNKYRNVDVLIIDDIQFLGGATQTQQEFFHTFNTLYNDSKQIIISSDRSPDDLKLLEDRLRTRFCWGLTVNIFPPDFNLRTQIIRRKIIAGNFEKEIPEDVIEYIASNIGTDVRQLEGSITRLIAYSTIMGGADITLDLAIEALKDFISKGISEKNDVHRIQKIVSEYFQITVEDIRSKKRSSNISFPRQIAMYLCRSMTNESFPKIGTEFGGKDHSTVMHSVEKIEQEIKVNPDLAKIIEKLKNDIGTGVVNKM